MDTSAMNLDDKWDSFVVSINEFVQIDNNFKQDYEDAIAAKLLVDLDNKSKYILGTLFNSIAKNIKKLHDQLIAYKDQADIDTFTTNKQDHFALLNKKVNHLGFKTPTSIGFETPTSTLQISDATPNNKEYKFVYTATLYCIAT
jgi:hypothetical protein